MTDKKIEKLTDEQTSKFDEYVDKWKAIGLSTEPVNFEAAKEAAILSYTLVGLPAPTKFYVADSLMDAIRLIKELDPSKTSSEIFYEMTYGSQDADWLSFYDFFGEVVGLECCDRLKGLMGLSKHSGWVSFYEDTVVFQHRPETIKFDDQKRLHCEDGPAIRYRDGYSVYSWHGVTIPSEWIEDKKAITPKIALTWKNIEQRRAACEIVGWVRIVDELGAKVIDRDGDPQIGELIEVDIPDIGLERFIKVLCGTGRTFCIPVPPDTKTALEGNAWTYDLDPDMLKQIEVRT